ncbi:CopL family metal-binding regulatory protein [Luteimonas pelagia]
MRSCPEGPDVNVRGRPRRRGAVPGARSLLPFGAMHTPVAALLRLLLCLALVLNGPGAALAAAHAHHSTPGHSQADGIADSPEVRAGDHGGHCEPSGSTADHSAGVPADGAAPSCCDGPECEGACPGVQVAAVLAPGPCMTGVEGRCDAMAPVAAHPSPPAARPTRPPIG